MGNKWKNKYLKNAHISESKFREILRCFSIDITATKTSELTGISRPTTNRIYKELMGRIRDICDNEFPLSAEVEIEVDESYFGAKRVKGNRDRGSYGKTIVFGTLESNAKVYTRIVPDCSRATVQAIIRGKVEVEGLIHWDKWRGYNGLVDIGYSKHFRVDHRDNKFSNGRSHINGIEPFWGFAKRRLQKFNGVSKKNFNLHLKGCEFRFNDREKDIYKILLNLLRKNML